MLNPAASDPWKLLNYAAETAPGSYAVLPVFDPARPDHTLVLKATVRTRPLPPAARESWAGTNGEEPPTHFETGRGLFIIPSDVAKNLRGPEDERDYICLMLVKRQVYDRMASGLVVPAPRIVLAAK